MDDRFIGRRMVVFSFTRTGTKLSRVLAGKLRNAGGECRGYAPAKYAGGGILPFPENTSRLVGCGWGKDAFLFIGAAGIAVRWIAPWVKDKYTDSPVLVIDENARYVIPILSGHIGGAVKLANEIAAITGAVPVHTTATDVQRKFAVDVFAEQNGLLITDRQRAKEISAAVLEEEKVGICIRYPEYHISGDIPQDLIFCDTVLQAEQYRYRILIGDGPEEDGTLILKPKNITAGIGCRKGISEPLLERGLCEILELNGLEIHQVERIASIDLKKEEPALVYLSEKYRIPFITWSADDLGRIRNVTSGSKFVEAVTGIDNVCERAARLCCPDGTIIQGKCVRQSMTAALARRPLDIRF